MIIYTNDLDEIKDVGVSTDETLTAHHINDNEMDNPFLGWSVAKICCYKATVENGRVTMRTPYVDSRLIFHIDQLGKATETNADDITITDEGLTQTYEITEQNVSDIDVALNAIADLYEMIGGMN